MKRIMNIVKIVLVLAFAVSVTVCCVKPNDDGGVRKMPIDGGKIIIKQDVGISGGFTVDDTLRGDKLLAKYNEIEQKYNCEIVVSEVPQSKLLNGIQTSADGSVRYADLIYTDTKSVYSLWRGGYLTALQDVDGFDISGENFGGDGMRQLLTFQDGKTYGFINTAWLKQLPDVSGILFYNKALCKQYNIETPGELEAKGKWNFESFVKICRNIAESGGYAFMTPTADDCDLIYSVIYAYGGERVSVSNNEYTCGYDSLASVKALEMLETLINDDKVSYTPASSDNGEDIKAFATGKTLFLSASSAEGFNSSEDGISAMLGEDLGWATLPKGPYFNKDNTAYYSEDTEVVAVTKFANEAEIGAVLNDIFAQTGDENIPGVINNYFFDAKDSTTYLTAVKQALSDRSVIASDTDPVVGRMFEQIVKGDKTAKEGLAQIAALISGRILNFND